MKLNIKYVNYILNSYINNRIKKMNDYGRGNKPDSLIRLGIISSQNKAVT